MSRITTIEKPINRSRTMAGSPLSNHMCTIHSSKKALILSMLMANMTSATVVTR